MFSEAEELLQKLIDEGIGISLVRNTTMPPKQFQETLNETGAHTYFHVNKNVILSGEIGKFKTVTCNLIVQRVWQT